ncbi:MAG: ABC transporter substrate-binding protein [Eubacteriales bacterium]|nr:ABC transporter substrate-binding protein [Eubacteriales bacterium]
MNKKIIIIVSLLLVLVMIFVGCTSKPTPQTPQKDTLIVATNAPPVDLDPHGTNDQNTNYVRYQIYEPLVSIGIDGSIEPGLATEWEWVDNTTINFKLREGVKFHNGKELIAEDVLFSLARAAEQSFTASNMVSVLLDQCKILDDGRIQIKLEVPQGALLSRLAQVMIFNKETWESAGQEEMLKNPVGTGPYKLTLWAQGDRLEFAAFDDYWDGPLVFKKLIMRIIPEAAARSLEIEAGTVDVALSIPDSNVEGLKANKDIKVSSDPVYKITYLGFDANVAPYDNVLVRQALTYAIDRDTITDLVYFGLATPATHGRMTTVHWGYTEDGVMNYSYDPQKAKQLLADAGYPNGFDMTLALSEAERDQIDMSEILQNQFKEVGINVKLEIIENSTFLNMIVNGGFDAFLLNSTGSSGDPGEVLRSFIADRPTWSNTTRYVNQYLTDLILEGQQTIDENKKLEIFKEAQQIISEECPWVFIVHNRYTFATRSNIGGLTAYPSTILKYKEAFIVN